MNAMSEQTEDVPKTVAIIINKIPRLALGTAISYLRFKRRIRRFTNELERLMETNGVPRETAVRLAGAYEQDLRLKNLMRLALRGGKTQGM